MFVEFDKVNKLKSQLVPWNQDVSMKNPQVMYGTFVAVFSKTSELNMTKQEGATVAAVFWGSFAAFRCVAIFLSLKLKSIHLISARYGPLRTYAFSPFSFK